MPRKSTLRKQNITGAAVIYARYSSHNQKDASIEQQVAECMEHAKSLGVPVIGTYADRAISGKTDKRPQFQKLMRDAAKGRFSFVLAWKSNRIGRNMLQAMMNEQKLNDYGIKVLYAEEDFDDTAAGRFALRSMMNVNQFYSENMAEDIQRGLMDNAKQCKVCGAIPFGYKVSKDHKYEIDEPKATIVREIFQRIASGNTISEIVRDLNDRGIRNRLGRPFNNNSFTGVLENERYRGIYIYRDIRIEGGVPRIISDELFFRVQEALRMKKNPRYTGRRKGSETYMLTGKLFCGECESPMVGVSGTSMTGDLHYYYYCQTQRKTHTCTKKAIKKELIETAVAALIAEYCLSDEIIELIAEKTIAHNKEALENSPVGLYESELAAVAKGIKNIMKAIESGIITPTTKKRLLELESKQAELKAKIFDAKSNIVEVTKDDMISGLTLFRNGEIEDKKYQARLIDTFLLAAYLYNDNSLKLVFNFTDDKNSINSNLDSFNENGVIKESKVRISKIWWGKFTPIRTLPVKLYMNNVGNFMLFINAV